MAYKTLTPDAVKYLAVHCSATQAQADIGAVEIDRWHRDRGFACIGYHYAIRRDGTIEKGRPDDMPGAHVLGYNECSLGICLVGGVKQVRSLSQRDRMEALELVAENNFVDAQFDALVVLLDALVCGGHILVNNPLHTVGSQTQLGLLVGAYRHATVQGHRDFPGVTKACPSFDVKPWWAARRPT